MWRAAGEILVGLVGGFIATVALLAIFIWLISHAVAQEVQPTRDARLGDQDNPDIYRPTVEPGINWDNVRDYNEITLLGITYDCTEHNASIVYKIGYVAEQIANAPKYGHFYINVLNLLASDLDEDCL